MAWLRLKQPEHHDRLTMNSAQQSAPCCPLKASNGVIPARQYFARSIASAPISGTEDLRQRVMADVIAALNLLAPQHEARIARLSPQRCNPCELLPRQTHPPAEPM